MKFPLDNNSRRSAGAKTGAIHDATGKTVMSVCRVNLPMESGETFDHWRRREIAATVERAEAIARTLNSCYAFVRSMGKHDEQLWLPGFEPGDLLASDNQDVPENQEQEKKA